MSSIATFWLLPRAALAALQAVAAPTGESLVEHKDRLSEVLAEKGRELATFEMSGYVVGTLIPYLEEKRGIDLARSSLGEMGAALSKASKAWVCLFAEEDRKWLASLEEAKFSEDELRDYYNEFLACDEPEAGHGMLRALLFVRQGLEQANADTVVLLHIG